MSAAQNLLLVFFVSDCKMALPVSDLIEIAEDLEVVNVNSDGFIAGSVELRGSAYPLIDIKKRLGLGEFAVNENVTFLLVNNLNGKYAFPVDSVAGVSESLVKTFSVPGFAFTDPDVISSFMMQGEDIVSVVNVEAIMRGVV